MIAKDSQMMNRRYTAETEREREPKKAKYECAKDVSKRDEKVWTE